MENTPTLYTERLVLRRFTPADAEPFFAFMRDEEMNRFLPMFPPKTVQEAGRYLEENYLQTYREPAGFRYAICLKEEEAPIGYVALGSGLNRDLGYGLARQHWHKGIVIEACGAVVAQLKKAGVPYITATHDVENPRSGQVMRNIGMAYRYTYREQWQPKDVPVWFRLYQLNLDGFDERVYVRYWDTYPAHYVEEDI